MSQRIWIVTGASSGLGYHIARQLNTYNKLVEDWSIDTGVDVTDFNSISGRIGEMIEADYLVEGIVNCAGIAHLSWFNDLSWIDYQKVMDVNAGAIMKTTQALITADLFIKEPTIVNVISSASRLPMTNSFAYNASKAAAEMMTRQMARELIKTHGITVFGISPNKLMGTEMTRQIDQNVQALRGWDYEEAVGYQSAGNGNLEYTDPVSVAKVLAFMLSQPEYHKFQNGAIIPMGV